MASNHLVLDKGEAQFITPALDHHPPPLELRDEDGFHVFVSYSSGDSQWTQNLISWLESPQCGLLTCYHERDFVPGRSILDNMADCIQRSQKVLLILSQDFVRSRWCLLEANMSLFRDCLECKPLVPVLLEPDVIIPVHLCHITYLNAKDPDFQSKLLKVLCTPNHQMQGTSVVPFHPPSVYNGKALQPLIALNEESLYKWEAGVFSDQAVPDQLRLVLQNDERYIAAIRMINRVSQTKVWIRPLLLRLFLYTLGLAFCILLQCTVTGCFQLNNNVWIYYFPSVAFLYRLCFWHMENEKFVRCEMQKCTGQANVSLAEEKVLMGCQSRTKLYFVYVSLERCKLMFNETFRESVLAEQMFKRALCHFSSGYACCLAKKHFPFDITNTHSHLEGSVCFCQYVSQQLKNDEWS